MYIHYILYVYVQILYIVCIYYIPMYMCMHIYTIYTIFYMHICMHIYTLYVYTHIEIKHIYKEYGDEGLHQGGVSIRGEKGAYM